MTEQGRYCAMRNESNGMEVYIEDCLHLHGLLV